MNGMVIVNFVVGLAVFGLAMALSSAILGLFREDTHLNRLIKFGLLVAGLGGILIFLVVGVRLIFGLGL
jgi:hypothetical protein